MVSVNLVHQFATSWTRIISNLIFASHPSFPHLIITTYGLVSSSVDDFTHNSYDWDYVVLDEAHKIKNVAAKISKNVRWLARGEETRRLVLTGTPIMNNLKELWALFDFVSSGQLLGSAMRYVVP